MFALPALNVYSDNCFSGVTTGVFTVFSGVIVVVFAFLFNESDFIEIPIILEIITTITIIDIPRIVPNTLVPPFCLA